MAAIATAPRVISRLSRGVAAVGRGSAARICAASTVSVRSYASSAEAQAAVFRQYGWPEKVLKVEKQSISSSLGANQVLLRLLAAPISSFDFPSIAGFSAPPLPAVGGNEGVFVVEKVGSAVKNLAVNSWVVPAKAGFGTWRTHAVAEEADVLPVPTNIPPEYAATISVAPVTAWALLQDFVKLKEGDVIVQNNASSSVAQAVIHFARERKIKTISILKPHTDYETIVERLKSWGGDIVVDEDYAASWEMTRLLSDLPKPKLALNAVGGTSATTVARLLGDGGVLVTYGAADSPAVTVPTSALVYKDITLRGFHLSRWIETHPPAERLAIIKTVSELIDKDSFKLFLERRPFSQFDAAFKLARDEFKEREIILTNE